MVAAMPYFEVQLTKKMQRIYDVGPDTTIGRAPQCQIQLLSRAVSRRHARIELGDRGEVIISDLGTKNGIKLNGKRVQGAAALRESDKLVVGDVSMTYRAADRSVAPEDVIDLRRRAPGPAEQRAALRPQVSFLLPSRDEALSQFQAVIGRDRIAGLEFDELTRFKLQIALKEALDNARVHGCGGDPNRSVQVTFTENDDEFMMSVKDDGEGYEVETVLAGAEELDAMEAIRNRAAFGTGLGLRIILNCVDRVQFEARGSNIHMGRFKDQGQIFVISEEGGESSGETGHESDDTVAVEPEAPTLLPLERDELSIGDEDAATEDVMNFQHLFRKDDPSQELKIGETLHLDVGDLEELSSTSGPWDESEEQGPLRLDDED